MARIRLTPQRREFFELYCKASANTVEIAAKLVELLERFPDGKEDSLRVIKELEHEGDRLTHDVIYLLNRTFVTPFDRDDMYRLASAIDDVCDHVDEAADNSTRTRSKASPSGRRSRAASSTGRPRGSTRRCSCSRASRTRGGSSSR